MEEPAGEKGYLGALLVLTSGVLDGVVFVLNEKYLLGSEKVEEIPGPLLCCGMGIWNSFLIFMWQFAVVWPDMRNKVYDPMARQHLLKGESYGTCSWIWGILSAIFCCGLFARASTMSLRTSCTIEPNYVLKLNLYM